MSDIVERLRQRKGFWSNGGVWMMGTAADVDCAEAADEIDRLRAENERLRAALEAVLKGVQWDEKPGHINGLKTMVCRALENARKEPT